MNTISKLAGEKGYVCRIEWISDETLATIHDFPPYLAANNLTMTTSTSGMYLSRRTYVPLFLQTVTEYIFHSHMSPSDPVYTRKTLDYKFFGFTRLFGLNMKINFKTTR